MLTEAQIEMVLGEGREPLLSPNRRFQLEMISGPLSLRTIQWATDPGTGDRRIWDVYEWAAHDILPAREATRDLLHAQPIERQQALLSAWGQRLSCILGRWDELYEMPNYRIAGRQLFYTERGAPILRLLDRRFTTSREFFMAMCQERVPMPRAR